MMNTIVDRIKSPTPKFFINLRNLALTIAGISSAILHLAPVLPHWLNSLLTVLASLSGGVAGTSQLVKK